jgi:hypothetical protein
VFSHELLVLEAELSEKPMSCTRVFSWGAAKLDLPFGGVVVRLAIPGIGPSNTRDQLRGAHDLALVHDDLTDEHVAIRVQPPLVSCIALFDCAPRPLLAGEAGVAGQLRADEMVTPTCGGTPVPQRQRPSVLAALAAPTGTGPPAETRLCASLESEAPSSDDARALMLGTPERPAGNDHPPR